jgi:hypothetical protein
MRSRLIDDSQITLFSTLVSGLREMEGVIIEKSESFAATYFTAIPDVVRFLNLNIFNYKNKME